MSWINCNNQNYSLTNEVNQTQDGYHYKHVAVERDLQKPVVWRNKKQFYCWKFVFHYVNYYCMKKIKEKKGFIIYVDQDNKKTKYEF